MDRRYAFYAGWVSRQPISALIICVDPRTKKKYPRHREIDLFMCSETRNSVSDDWGERCILAQKAECAAVGSILCGFLGMVKILKLTVATLCSDCNSDFRGGHCIGCSSWPPSAKLKLTAM